MFLSVCIPTYNRSQYLRESLKLLLPQILQIEEDVEVLVSDNCSTDLTQQVVEEIRKEYNTDIKYSRNESNIGGNNNITKVVGQSLGRYVLIMGDDDIISPDLIKTLIRILKKTDGLGLLFFNRLAGDINCSNCSVCDPFYETTERSYPPEEFVLRIMDKANFISSIVFNRRCWELGESHLDEFRYFGYQWYARLFWGAIELNKPCVYYYMPLVIQRDGEKTWLKFWPHYYLGSMSNIFQDLDVKIPGVYEKWSKKLRTVAIPTIKAMVPFKDYYKQEKIKKNIQQHLTKSEIIKMNFYLNFPLAGLWFRLRNKVGRLFNK